MTIKIKLLIVGVNVTGKGPKRNFRDDDHTSFPDLVQCTLMYLLQKMYQADFTLPIHLLKNRRSSSSWLCNLGQATLFMSSSTSSFEKWGK